jgi:hypothetical protein
MAEAGPGHRLTITNPDPREEPMRISLLGHRFEGRGARDRLGEVGHPVTTDPCRPLSAAEVQALHRRVRNARDLDVDPDPTDLATARRLNADELEQFDRSWGGKR